MKKIFMTLFFSIITLSLVFCYAKYFWLGFRVSNGGGMIQIEIIPDGLDFNITPMSPAYGVTTIESKIYPSSHKIEVWYYKKFIGLLSGQKSNSKVQISTPGVYSIFYLNPDGSEQFIQNIEYK